MTYYEIEDGLFKGKIYYRMAWDNKYLFHIPYRKVGMNDLDSSEYPADVKLFIQNAIIRNNKPVEVYGGLCTINDSGAITRGFTLHHWDMTADDWQELNCEDHQWLSKVYIESR